MPAGASNPANTSATLRVEDLARAADVSVDTIRFYQKRRLLPPPTRRHPAAGARPGTGGRAGCDASQRRIERRAAA